MPSMSSGARDTVTQDQSDLDLNLSILGIGAEYPPYRHGSDSLDTLAARFYKPSTAYVHFLGLRGCECNLTLPLA